MSGPKAVFVGITGASGAVYGLRLVEVLLGGGHGAHLCASEWGQKVVEQETGTPWPVWTDRFAASAPGRFHVHDTAAMGSGPASGSFLIDAAVVVPCSMATLGHLASGAATNLVHRAATVSMKEGRPLILVPRETPLGLIDLRNLTTLAEAGAAILPAMPAFYHQPQSIGDLVDFVVGKILDRLGVAHQQFPRWEGKEFP